jgi:hypothetical protein
MSDPYGTINPYRKGGSVMAEQFIDTIAEHKVALLQKEIGEELFDQWSYNNLEEGEAYAEFRFMEYASRELKQQYNEYYGYIEGDEFCL